MVKVKQTRKIPSFIFSLLIIILSLALLKNTFGVLALICGLFMFPPINNWVYIKTKFETKIWLKVIISIVGFIFIFIAIGSQINKSESSNTLLPEYSCPDLSNMKLQGYDNLMQTWTAKIFSYKLENAEVVYTLGVGSSIIFCDAGSQEGQNANWVYCGDFIRPIVVQYTDAKGTIINKRSIEVTFDKNTKQYLSTKCDTYELT